MEQQINTQVEEVSKEITEEIEKPLGFKKKSGPIYYALILEDGRYAFVVEANTRTELAKQLSNIDSSLTIAHIFRGVTVEFKEQKKIVF